MIQSPCVAKCGLNEDDVCMACYRHVDEIVGWGQADDKFKAAVWKQIPARKALLGKGENTQKLSREKRQQVAARLQANTKEVAEEVAEVE